MKICTPSLRWKTSSISRRAKTRASTSGKRPSPWSRFLRYFHDKPTCKTKFVLYCSEIFCYILVLTFIFNYNINLLQSFIKLNFCLSKIYLRSRLSALCIPSDNKVVRNVECSLLFTWLGDCASSFWPRMLSPSPRMTSDCGTNGSAPSRPRRGLRRASPALPAMRWGDVGSGREMCERRPRSLRNLRSRFYKYNSRTYYSYFTVSHHAGLCLVT